MTVSPYKPKRQARPRRPQHARKRAAKVWGRKKGMSFGRQLALAACIGIAGGLLFAFFPETLPGRNAPGALAVSAVESDAPQPAERAGALLGAARISDGDTLRLGGETIRLVGIDAPERDQTCERRNGATYRCGEAARNYLAALTRGTTIKCEGTERDRYGRLLATCYASDVNLNAEMVRAGHALAYRHYSTRYLPEEESAKAAATGMWQGRFTEPWDWRQGSRIEATAATDCNIKGNISGSGRIYHLPGSKWYEKTQINPGKGERWFCSEEEAIAAGWRAARSPSSFD